jgi:nuclear pore complex protein Nup205
VLERLLLNLEAHLEELKALLDKKPKNEKSRQALASGNECTAARAPTRVC